MHYRQNMNFVRSLQNPDSRLHRLIRYLQEMGPSAKMDILRDVFGIEVTYLRWPHTLTDHKTHSWGSTLFSLGVVNGFLTKTRKGNITLWSVGPNWDNDSQADGSKS
jgi:hypothetical protein